MHLLTRIRHNSDEFGVGMMSRTSRLLAAAAVIAATTAGGLTASSSVWAGDGTPVIVDIEVYAPDANAVLEGLTVEIWDIGASPAEIEPGTGCGTPVGFDAIALADSTTVNCYVSPIGDYAIGLDGVPAGATVSAACIPQFLTERIPGIGAEFSIGEGEYQVNCVLTVVQPAVIIDKEVANGTASTDDFTMEVFGEGGTKAGRRPTRRRATAAVLVHTRRLCRDPGAGRRLPDRRAHRTGVRPDQCLVHDLDAGGAAAW